MSRSTDVEGPALRLDGGSHDREFVGY